MVDRLSNGRVSLAFTGGWNPGDYVFAPESFERRAEVAAQAIEQVRRLWRGESLPYVDGLGRQAQVATQPRPVRRELPVWLTCTERRERFEQAGRMGFNVLTALRFQDLQKLREHIAIYRRARQAAGHDRGHVTLSVHTFVGDDLRHARHPAGPPLRTYLASSVNLWQQRAAALSAASTAERDRALDFATQRYLDGALVGSAADCKQRVRSFAEAGVDEVACWVDFGISADEVVAGLGRLGTLW